MSSVQSHSLPQYIEGQHIESSYGYIFLFKYTNTTDERETLDPLNLPNLWFARQIVTNACATQAILSVLFNSSELNLGTTLTDFKSIVGSFDSEMKGVSIGNSEEIRIAHNSFAKPDLFVGDDKPKVATDNDEVYHFIAYVPLDGVVYELDGLKSGPIALGNIPESGDWKSVIIPVVQARFAAGQPL